MCHTVVGWNIFLQEIKLELNLMFAFFFWTGGTSLSRWAIEKQAKD